MKGVLNIFYLLIKGIRLVDGDDEPTMELLDKAMERKKNGYSRKL